MERHDPVCFSATQERTQCIAAVRARVGNVVHCVFPELRTICSNSLNSYYLSLLLHTRLSSSSGLAWIPERLTQREIPA